MSNPKGMARESIASKLVHQSAGQKSSPNLRDVLESSAMVSPQTSQLSQVNTDLISAVPTASLLAQCVTSVEGSVASVPPAEEPSSEISSIERILNQILKELRDLKISHEDAHKKTNEQLGQINTSIL
ncbi:hypothetical protein NDU88_002091 [Pleurodeles waltl]|uniref:Uncharacterized protein n=1 Tax=Pleurodeles waltl TaxID=8319 RepID=A0AAV7UC81_PLEWA|nr:hypothetical protein NDU88_002091 [Pleurodeles waltl]